MSIDLFWVAGTGHPGSWILQFGPSILLISSFLWGIMHISEKQTFAEFAGAVHPSLPCAFSCDHFKSVIRLLVLFLVTFVPPLKTVVLYNEHVTVFLLGFSCQKIMPYCWHNANPSNKLYPNIHVPLLLHLPTQNNFLCNKELGCCLEKLHVIRSCIVVNAHQ